MQVEGGKDTLVTKVRNLAWILRLDKLAQKCDKGCFHCQRVRKLKELRPPEPPLHGDRVPAGDLEAKRPFTVVGCEAIRIRECA